MSWQQFMPRLPALGSHMPKTRFCPFGIPAFGRFNIIWSDPQTCRCTSRINWVWRRCLALSFNFYRFPSLFISSRQAFENECDSPNLGILRNHFARCRLDVYKGGAGRNETKDGKVSGQNPCLEVPLSKEGRPAAARSLFKIRA